MRSPFATALVLTGLNDVSTSFLLFFFLKLALAMDVLNACRFRFAVVIACRFFTHQVPSLSLRRLAFSGPWILAVQAERVAAKPVFRFSVQTLVVRFCVLQIMHFNAFAC